MKGLESVDLGVAEIFCNEETPDCHPSFDGVAVLDSHEYNLVDHFKNIGSIEFWCFWSSRAGCGHCILLPWQIFM